MQIFLSPEEWFLSVTLEWFFLCHFEVTLNWLWTDYVGPEYHPVFTAYELLTKSLINPINTYFGVMQEIRQLYFTLLYKTPQTACLWGFLRFLIFWICSKIVCFSDGHLHVAYTLLTKGLSHQALVGCLNVCILAVLHLVRHGQQFAWWVYRLRSLESKVWWSYVWCRVVCG